ncbi:hypothetical protein LSH36_83g04001 [Paralvinella palmiformis]|uniref:Anaphase-promoting complex subunit 4-like WD40 domain-containing protein n=1 Tax=Paralvinella palmiformis TaxID=53620 RepID=A0AAD9K3H3_9ANNE|nr:hypothetical protein LSH36_83g04001 [Paralvinella palmiformis]
MSILASENIESELSLFGYDFPAGVMGRCSSDDWLCVGYTPNGVAVVVPKEATLRPFPELNNTGLFGIEGVICLNDGPIISVHSQGPRKSPLMLCIWSPEPDRVYLEHIGIFRFVRQTDDDRSLMIAYHNKIVIIDTVNLTCTHVLDFPGVDINSAILRNGVLYVGTGESIVSRDLSQYRISPHYDVISSPSDSIILDDDDDDEEEKIETIYVLTLPDEDLPAAMTSYGPRGVSHALLLPGGRQMAVGVAGRLKLMDIMDGSLEEMHQESHIKWDLDSLTTPPRIVKSSIVQTKWRLSNNRAWLISLSRRDNSELADSGRYLIIWEDNGDIITIWNVARDDKGQYGLVADDEAPDYRLPRDDDDGSHKTDDADDKEGDSGDVLKEDCIIDEKRSDTNIEETKQNYDRQDSKQRLTDSNLIKGNTADSIDKVNTADSMDKVNTADSMDKVNTADSTDEVNTADSMDKINTADSTDKVNTADITDKVNTADSTDKVNTPDKMEEQPIGNNQEQENIAENTKMDGPTDNLERHNNSDNHEHGDRVEDSDEESNNKDNPEHDGLDNSKPPTNTDTGDDLEQQNNNNHEQQDTTNNADRQDVEPNKDEEDDNKNPSGTEVREGRKRDIHGMSVDVNLDKREVPFRVRSETVLVVGDEMMIGNNRGGYMYQFDIDQLFDVKDDPSVLAAVALLPNNRIILAKDPPKSLSLAAGDRMVISLGTKGYVTILNRSNPTKQVVLDRCQSKVSNISLSMDHTMLLVGYIDGTIRLWSAVTGDVLCTVPTKTTIHWLSFVQEDNAVLAWVEKYRGKRSRIIKFDVNRTMSS